MCPLRCDIWALLAPPPPPPPPLWWSGGRMSHPSLQENTKTHTLHTADCSGIFMHKLNLRNELMLGVKREFEKEK